MRYARSSKAKGRCDRCGFTVLLHDLKPETQDGRRTGLKVCSTCWDVDHPLFKRGRYRFDDPQTLRDPRPDADQQASTSYFGWDPVGGLGMRITIELGAIEAVVGV